MIERQEAPWGHWEILLDSSYCKVKQIVVNPGNRLSYQKHQFRQELWTIVQGIATVTLDGINQEYHVGDVVSIGMGQAHRVANKHVETLRLIEIQRGSYFGEDDIVRLDDDYGRS